MSKNRKNFKKKNKNPNSKIYLDPKEMVRRDGLPTKKFYTKEFETRKIKKYYAIKDKTAERFMMLTEKVNDAVAIRDLSLLTNESGNLVNKCPSNFSMYRIGYFDEENGDFISDIAEIGKAEDYVETKN